MSADAAAPLPPATFFRRHRWKIILLGVVMVAVGVAALWVLITLSFTYSDGDRIGYVQKFSHKGWICPTWAMPPRARPAYQAKKPRNIETTVR